jgi:hypothetical protein
MIAEGSKKRPQWAPIWASADTLAPSSAGNTYGDGRPTQPCRKDTQHLRIKKFYGVSPNAVKTQIWIAISVYVLLAIVRKQLGLELNLYPMSQILSLRLFEKVPLLQAFSDVSSQCEIDVTGNQLELFNL